MAFIETFAALAIAHVASDYLLQIRWIALNKRAALPMAAHVGTVGATSWAALGFAALPGVALLTLAHLAMDLLKSHRLAKTGLNYGIDQAVHFATILVVALILPGAWRDGIWATAAPDTMHTVLAAGVLAMGALYATRGGVFFVDHLVAAHGAGLSDWAQPGSPRHRRAMLQRAVVFAGMIALPVLTAAICAARIAHLVWRARTTRPAQGALAGMLGSFGWALMAGLGTQLTVRALAALDARGAAAYPLV